MCTERPAKAQPKNPALLSCQVSSFDLLPRCICDLLNGLALSAETSMPEIQNLDKDAENPNGGKQRCHFAKSLRQ